MPELPEVEIVRRNCERWWLGRALVAVEVFDARLLVGGDAGALDGLTLRRAVRRGKRLGLELTGPGGGEGVWLLLHFRMTGKLVRSVAPVAHARARFGLAGEAASVWFKDQRCLGELWVSDAVGAAAWLEACGLGPEPWPVALAGDVLRRRLGATRRRIKDALLDPQVVAGVGNIAACEALWRARVAPQRGCDTLDEAALGRLGQGLRAHIEHTLAHEDGDEVVYLGEAGAQDAHFLVYGRAGEPCARCGAVLERTRLGGRVTYWCAGCQR